MPDNVQCEYAEVGRKYHKYKKSTNRSSLISLLVTDSDWPSPDTYYKFFYQNISDSLKNLIQPSPNLINTESGIEETSTAPTQYSFYPGQQQIGENIKRYNNVPVKYFINESYFLYGKSDLIKETYITALNKKYQYLLQ